MEKNFDLRQYVNTVVELERDLRTMNISIGNLKKQRSQLGHKVNLTAPVEYVIQEPEYNRAGDVSAIGIAIGLVAIGICSYKISAYHGAAVFLLFLFAITACIVLAVRFGRKKADKERYKSLVKFNKEDYLQRWNNYQSQLTYYNNKFEKETQMITVVESDIAALTKKYNDTLDLLNKYYDLNVIYPSYRNIATMAMFAQYLNTGRCSKLEGHEGCYNLYESEKRQDLIITQLDTVLQKLDQIRDNQYELMTTLETSNKNIEQLTSYSRDALDEAKAAKEHLKAIEWQTEQSNRTNQATQRYILTRDLLLSM